MADESCPDLAISIEIMVALMERLNRLWMLAREDRNIQGEVLFPALFSIAAYGQGGSTDAFVFDDQTFRRRNKSKSSEVSACCDVTLRSV